MRRWGKCSLFREAGLTPHITRSSGGAKYSGISPASARLILAAARRNPVTPVPAIAAAELCGEPITFGNDMNG